MVSNSVNKRYKIATVIYSVLEIALPHYYMHYD